MLGTHKAAPAALAFQVFLLTADVLPVAANVPTLGNKAEGAALCALAAAATAPFTLPELNAAGNDDFAKLHALNLSLPGPLDTKTFKHKTPHDDWQEHPPDAKASDTAWKANYPRWLKGAQYIENNRANDNDQVKAAIQGLTQAQRTVAQSQLQPILAAANLAEAELQQAQQTLRTAKAKTLTSKLAKAAFGKEGGEPQTPQDTDFFSEAISSTRDTTCDNAAGKNAKVKTIAAAVICLCSGAGTGSEKHACFKAPSLNADWSRTGDSTRTIWALLKPFCGGRSGKTLTADSLQTALEQVLNLIYAGSGAAFLGALETGATCTGANTAGMCIKFTGATTRSAEQITTSPWVAAISDAIQTLQAVEKAARQQAQATTTLRSLLESALATTAEAKQTKIENSITTDHQSTTKEKDCSTHKTNTTCTENKCKWEGTTEKDGKCTVDGSKVTTQTTATAGKGDGTAGTAASTGCASHFTDQKECEKMNEGKEKHVCAWKKGGEGDKDKDELRCRNGSFLVNNQFALLVS